MVKVETNKYVKRVLTAVVAVPIVLTFIYSLYSAYVLAMVALVVAVREHARMRSSTLARAFPTSEIPAARRDVLLCSTAMIMSIPILRRESRPSIAFVMATQLSLLLLPFFNIIHFAMKDWRRSRGPKKKGSNAYTGKKTASPAISSSNVSRDKDSEDGVDLAVMLCHSGLDLLFLVQYCLPLAFVVMMRNLKGGAGFAVVWLLCTFQSDNGGLLFGNRFGKRRILPNLSPNKSLEGLCGSVLLSVSSSLMLCFLSRTQLFSWASLPPVSAWHYAAIGTLISIVGIIGDLLESAAKRAAGMKDSGNLLPGHGGVLDRMDSLTVSGSLMYFYIIGVIPAT